MKHFVYKGIDVIFTKGATRIAESQEEKEFVLAAFFEENPPNSIQWISEKETVDARGNERDLPMYHMTRADDETLLFWPLLDSHNSNLVLVVEDLKEKPELENEIEKYYGD